MNDLLDHLRWFLQSEGRPGSMRIDWGRDGQTRVVVELKGSDPLTIEGSVANVEKALNALK